MKHLAVVFITKRPHKHKHNSVHAVRSAMTQNGWLSLFKLVDSQYSPVNPRCVVGSQVRNRLNVTERSLRTTLWRWVGDLFPRRPGSHFSPAAHSQPVTKWAGAAPPRLQRAAASEPPRGPLMSGNPILQLGLEDFSRRWSDRRVVKRLIYLKENKWSSFSVFHSLSSVKSI